ncbi:DNA-binding response regulator, NarL/FixJ family, contains REC and HTH domains [Pedococcus dokdonensis]|uniref:DNA-binding response regulator, NarL/FixJ family, contains REC and HTH domains n=1 Tax=Pedococcus dokdonensis TaxID=443156 RepID=A0A1H0PGF7_9MICO|nr:response regulator transcription factor [Pedococcus dokdonensis]SDP04192.1 DNA-binding response regulator, NarL/FixJ family, contains REC and HTH domains [Pedococcus dokdonensis]
MSADPAATRPSVVVIDDSTVIRGGFATVHPGLDVVATYANVEDFEAARVDCDVVVLDLLLRGPQGVESTATKQGRAAIRALRSLGHRVCLYTDERRALVLALCLRAGASGVVHKSDPPEVAVRAVQDIRDGQVVVTQSLVGLTELLDRRGAALALSPRQRQVISARARGRHWGDIAAELYITEGVAREHYQAACAKLRDYLQHTSAGDIELAFGVGPGDLLEED